MKLQYLLATLFDSVALQSDLRNFSEFKFNSIRCVCTMCFPRALLTDFFLLLFYQSHVGFRTKRMWFMYSWLYRHHYLGGEFLLKPELFFMVLDLLGSFEVISTKKWCKKCWSKSWAKFSGNSASVCESVYTKVQRTLQKI